MTVSSVCHLALTVPISQSPLCLIWKRARGVGLMSHNWPRSCKHHTASCHFLFQEMLPTRVKAHLARFLSQHESTETLTVRGRSIPDVYRKGDERYVATGSCVGLGSRWSPFCTAICLRCFSQVVTFGSAKWVGLALPKTPVKASGPFVEGQPHPGGQIRPVAPCFCITAPA